jgi:hypothetical protein
MKKIVKLVLVAIPALLVVATVGMASMGCGDDTAVPTADLSAVRDMAQPNG